jgi:hypothetical protein
MTVAKECNLDGLSLSIEQVAGVAFYAGRADRRMDHDIARIAALIRSGGLRRAARLATRPATVPIGATA